MLKLAEELCISSATVHQTVPNPTKISLIKTLYRLDSLQRELVNLNQTLAQFHAIIPLEIVCDYDSEDSDFFNPINRFPLWNSYDDYGILITNFPCLDVTGDHTTCIPHARSQDFIATPFIH